jgi:hypothetical protein
MSKTRKNARSNKRKPKILYNKEDYDSNDGMLTSVWGPSMWHFLHTMSFNYPVHPTKEDKIKYFDFVYSIKNILPCGKCRVNLKSNFGKKPLKMCHMLSRDTFSKYIYELHEVINDMLGKKSNLSFDVVRDRYEHFRARCVQNVEAGGGQTPLEKGCVEPLYGKKTKCVLKIVPQTNKCDTFQMSA